MKCVDPGPVFTAEVTKDPTFFLARDSGMLTRDAFVLEVKIAVGRASDHDRAVADRENLISIVVVISKATENFVIALQFRTSWFVPEGSRRCLARLEARRPPFLSALWVRCR